MTVILILIGALFAVGLPLWFHHHFLRKENVEETAPEQPAEEQEECCGMHITCERDSLLAAVSEKIEYYDDEELDRFIGRGEKEYSDTEIEEFRDILLTMRPDDIAGWARSLQLRGITLPAPVRDELLMIVAEERASRSAS